MLCRVARFPSPLLMILLREALLWSARALYAGKHSWMPLNDRPIGRKSNCWHTAVGFIGIVSTVVDSVASFPCQKTSSIRTTFSNVCARYRNVQTKHNRTIYIVAASGDSEQWTTSCTNQQCRPKLPENHLRMSSAMNKTWSRITVR